MQNKISFILQGITLLLTAAILVILLIPQSGTVNNTNNDYVTETLEKEKAMKAYQLDVGSKNITISNDKISKSSYSSYIIGDVTNNANKTIYGVSVHISFYQNGNFIESTTDYFSEIPAKSTVQLNAYAPDNFTTYSIDYTLAYFLD